MGALEILMWLLPTGFLSNVVTWVISRKIYNARNRKEQEIIYKELYEAQGETLLKIQENYSCLQNNYLEINEKQNKTMRILQRISQTVKRCRYYDKCRVPYELRNFGCIEENNKPLGQPDNGKEGDHLRVGTEEDDDAGGICRPPP